MTTPQPEQAPEAPSPAPRSPSPATAVASGAVGLFVALGAGSQALTMAYIFSGGLMPGSAPGTELSPAAHPVMTWFLVPYVVAAFGAVLLLAGAILLFARFNAGRYLTIAGAFLLIGVEVVQTFVIVAASELAFVGVGPGAFGIVFLLWKFVLPAVAAVLAALPSTAVWLAAKHQ
ncbi:hypothetical protein FKR81_27310 [Lentzea tibetensis]|uniref:Uncharacterized protein n=1 Tax=Lentzea tibetensis TaxID=2591470 RepID=A0A563EPJ8_9PSEU|nr:hypothetical protein [Lentzea tibetensis]TWP48637.1 hypothetical protein FKR81_27310 [Lentzea tibetensis]